MAALRDVYAARPSARRAREEATLDMLRAVRADLWGDLAPLIEDQPRSLRTVLLVTRIRRIGIFLGSPTSWRDVPVHLMKWYVAIEEMPELYLHHETPDWEDLDDIEFNPVDPVAIDMYDNHINMNFGDDDDATGT